MPPYVVPSQARVDFVSNQPLLNAQRPAPPPEVNDDVYYSDVSIKGKWQVRYAGRVTIEVDDEGVVNVYGISYSSNNTTVRPDIKVIGNGLTFKVHNADNVKADDGVTLYA